MAGELKAKRTYSETTSFNADHERNIIDLTLDSDDERPSKRPKSSSNSLTPTDDVVDVDFDTDAPSLRKKINGQSKVNHLTSHVNGVIPEFTLSNEKPLIFETQADQTEAKSALKLSQITDESTHVKPQHEGSLAHHPKPTKSILASDVSPQDRISTSGNGSLTYTKLNGQADPYSKPVIRINVPLLASIQKLKSPEEKQKARETERKRESRRKGVISRLKESTSYAQHNPEEIEDLFGITGFSKLYTSDLKPRIRVAQRKRQPTTGRDQVSLNLEDLVISTKDDASSAELRHPRRQARDVFRERLQNGDKATISFENRRNHRLPDGKFQFIDHYILSSRVARRKPALYPPRACQCPGGQCGYGCECFRHRVGDEERRNIQIPTYCRRNGLVVLSDEFMKAEHESLVIRECGPSCNCSSECINRVTQNGRTVPLLIFETQKCGFGVRSEQDIHRGQFLDFYFGEVITDAELARREDAVDEDTPSYVLSLDYFAQTGPTFHVDSSNFGSVTRFFNHSCAPNCKTYNVILEGDSKLLYHIAFFAVKDIPKGTELTIDYDPHLTLMVGEEEAAELEEDVVRCQCGEPNCRKRLWPKGKERRRRKKRMCSDSD